MRGGGVQEEPLLPAASHAVREEPLLPAASHYKDVDDEFLQRVTENTKRYIGIFAEAVDELMPEPTEAFAVDEDRDILMTHYEGADGGADGTDPLQRMPPEIKRFFEDVIASGAGDDAICLYAENKSSMVEGHSY